jgi:DNA-binding winged helix-turn-helix (wHTH) protein/TolB-like protein
MIRQPASSRARFGLFELDAVSGELRRDGTPVHLQPQPAAVLQLLVARAGAMVTREDLRQAVWGSETFVDFDRGLNFCIAQIRAALGDAADAPRYIRTIPRRGYQFIAPVEIIQTADGAAQPALSASAVAPAVEPGSRLPRSRITGALAIVAATAVIVAAAGWWSIGRTTPGPAAPVVAVALFDADSGGADATRFAQGLTDAVVAELTTAGEGRFAVIGNAAILRSARTFRDLEAIDLALHVQYVVLGSVQRDGDRLRVLAHLIRLPEQTHLSVARLDRTVGDPLGTQAELAQAIAARFSARLTADRAPGRPSPQRATN